MPVLDIDVQGATTIHKNKIISNFVFIKPCEDISLAAQVLRERLSQRGTETEERINKRVANAASEFEAYSKASFFTHTVVNDELDLGKSRMKTVFDACYPVQIKEFGNKDK